MHFALHEPNNYYYDAHGYDNSNLEYLVSEYKNAIGKILLKYLVN